MRHVLVLAAFALFAVAIACAKDVSGVWKFEATGARGGTSTMTCTLTRSGNTLAGSCVTRQGSTVDVSGAVTGHDVDFGYIVTGSLLHVDFKGVIQSDGSIKGVITAAIPPVPFIGTKQ
ncbi:MAG: hypothetical protein ACYDAE_27590 [Steroidobacteraceae bacterium]